jgi:hypothetical protein
VACFGQFWAADRPAMRRLRALALLDPDVGAVITARDQRRHQGLTVLAGRLAGTSLAGTSLTGTSMTGAEADRAVRVLVTLTSFETFDTLAGPDRDITAAGPDIVRLCEVALRPD